MKRVENLTPFLLPRPPRGGATNARPQQPAGRTQRADGAGAAHARRLAELRGGTIEVESEHGKGSTFTLRLPVRETV